MRLAATAVLSLLLAVSVSSCDDAGPERGGIEITVLAAYTGAAAADGIEAQIRAAVEETNVVYAGSRTGARLALVGVVPVDYAERDRSAMLADLIGTDDGALDGLHRQRDAMQADVVVLVTASPGSTVNGAILATAETAFVIVEARTLGAPSFGLAHEIGHLHGARHAPEADPASEPFPWGHAFRGETVRTVVTSGGVGRRVPFFSGPGLTAGGVTLGDAAERDVARVVRESAAYLSNFRGPQTPTPFVPPGTWPTLGGDRR